MMCSLALLIFCWCLSSCNVYCYSNVTMRSNELEVTIYLPSGVEEGEKGDKVFYKSSRFEHGSMIGSVKRRVTQNAATTTTTTTRTSGTDFGERIHQLYGDDLWRVPHDPHWPESGIGLASEFGVGANGAVCDYRCGWREFDNVANGVLGYREARVGESFLKIGVGELIKGSCESCDSTEAYKFNSPYQFAKPPQWTMESPMDNVVLLSHEAILERSLKKYGYRLQKEISLVDNMLLVTSTLTNLGSEVFASAWYSHHFFSCDDKPIGPGYAVDFDLHGTPSNPLYEEPGLVAWAKSLGNYARVTPSSGQVKIDMMRHVEDGTKIKAEFIKDKETVGAFKLRSCGTAIIEDIPELQNTPGDPVSMYAFNLYIEKGTFSPEPQILIKLEPGQSKSWTQRLVFSDDYSVPPTQEPPTRFMSFRAMRTSLLQPPSRLFEGTADLKLIGILLCICAFLVFTHNNRRSSRQEEYSPIPDSDS